MDDASNYCNEFKYARWNLTTRADTGFALKDVPAIDESLGLWDDLASLYHC